MEEDNTPKSSVYGKEFHDFLIQKGKDLKESLGNQWNKFSFQEQPALLDIGAGYGGTSRYLNFKHGFKVDGLDYDQDVIRVFEEFNKLYDQNDLKDIRVFCKDFLKVKEENEVWANKYDACVVQGIIHLIEDKRTFIQNIAMCLKSGGVLFLDDFCQSAEIDEHETQFYASNYYGVNGKFVYLSEIEKLIQEAGMVIERKEDVTEFAHDFAWDRFEKFYTKTGPYQTTQQRIEVYLEAVKNYRFNADTLKNKYPNAFGVLGEWYGKKQTYQAFRIYGKKL